MSRRGAKHARTSRRIGNEPELMAMLSALPGCSVQLVDLAPLSLPAQLELIASTDILIGEPAVACGLLTGLFP